MRDVDEFLEEVGTLAGRPPAAATAVEEIRRRVRRRARRRRGVVAGAIVVVATMALGVTVTTLDRPSISVSADGPGRRTPAQLTADPSVGLEDGMVVSVGGRFPDGAIDGVAQCSSDAIDSADPLRWCDLNVAWEAKAADRLEVTVRREIDTPEGVRDCGEIQCVIGVRVGGRDRFASISFTDEAVRKTVLKTNRDQTADGGHLRVIGEGFPPSTEVVVALCIGSVHDVRGGKRLERCDLARAATLRSDGLGRLDAPFIAYADVLLYDGWTRCSPCVLQASGFRIEPAAASLQVALVGPAKRPSVTIEPAGPYASDQVVRLRGEHFAEGSQPYVGWCRFHSDHPELEAAGGGDADAGCVYPQQGFGAEVDADGAIVIEGYPMPSAGFAPECRDGAAACGLSWHPSEGSPPAFVTMFQLR
jgi:hypothetical protein